MYKLYFRYGSMNSSKTANLLMVAYNYKQKGKKVVLIKPKIDDRFGEKYIASRCGMKMEADIIVDEKSELYNIYDWKKYDCVLVDEVSFLTPKQIEELRKITEYIPVIGYGLRTDYKRQLFPGSKRLMELADSIEEIKNICTFCNKKAIFNMKINKDGKAIKDGSNDIEIGAEDKYISVCYRCYEKE